MVGKLGRILGRARPHAEPEGRHRHLRHRARRRRGEGRPGRVQGRQGRDHPRPRRQGELRRARRSSANLAALLDAVNRAKPTGAKGTYLKGVTIASTMGPGIRVDLPALLRRGRGRLTGAAPARGAPGRRSATIPQRGPPTGAPHQIEDGPPQTACARGPRRRSPDRARRDGRGLIRRTGPAPAEAGTGDAGEHAEAGPPAIALPGADPRGPCETRGTHRLAGAPPGGSTGRAGSARTREGCMPTEAKRATVAELREDLAASSDADHDRVPGPDGPRDRRDPSRASEEQRHATGSSRTA